MATARLRKTLEQRVVFSVEVKHVAADIALAHFLEQFWKALELAQQVARVDGHGHLRQEHVGMREKTLGQVRHEAGGKVVDAIEAVVFQGIESRTLARAGTTTGDDEAHAY